MKNYFLLYSSVPALALVAALFSFDVARADDTFAYSSGEKEVFADTFADSSKGWILDANSEIKDGKWGPKTPNVPGGSDSVSMSVALPAVLKLSGGPISIYFSMATNAITGGDACKVSVTLETEDGKRFVGVCIIPRNQLTDILVQGRNSDGKAIADSITSQDVLTYFKKTDSFINYRLLVTQPDGIFAIIEPFVWDGSTWRSLGAVSVTPDQDKYDVQSGSFKKLAVSTRNSSGGLPDPRSFLDAIAITQAEASVPVKK